MIFKDEELIGIDLGTTAIRLVQFKNVNGRPTLVSFGSVNIPANLTQSDSKLDQQKIAQSIKQLVQATKPNTKNVVTCLSGASVFSTILKMPPMSPGELESAVKYQAEQNLPLKSTEIKMDWQIVRQNPVTKESIVLVVAAPNSKIEKVLETFEMADLEVMYLETTQISVARALTTPQDSVVMIVSLGASFTEIAIVENTIVSHVRSLPLGGIAMTRAISQNLGLDFSQAEQFKMKFGLSQDKLEGQVFKSIKPILNNITDEISRSIKYYQDQFNAPVNKIIITGGGARLPEIASYLKTVLGTEVVYGNPWSKISFQPELTDKLNQNALEFSCGVGLALREITNG